MRTATALLAAAAATLGCRESGVEVEANDPEMFAATLKARDSVDEFLEALTNPQPGQAFAVKARFGGKEDAEYLWLSNVRFDGERFIGTVANIPERATDVHHGDEHAIPKDELIDWAIVDGDRKLGAYTDAVLEKRSR